MKTQTSVRQWDSFESIARDLVACGWLKEFVIIDETAIAATCTQNWNLLAKAASEVSGGQWHMNSTGVRWQMGNNSYYFIAPSAVKEVEESRATCQDFTGELSGWSHGSAARKMIKFAVGVTKADKRADELIANGRIGFHTSTPARYSVGALYDVSGAYFQLIDRLPSPRLIITRDGKLNFNALTLSERTKWNELKTEVAQHKRLRNSVWGCMLGSDAPRHYWRLGEYVQAPIYHGTHRASAALVARSMWELCREAAEETQASYAQTDSLIITTERNIGVWDRVGLRYQLQFAGETDIKRQHVYKVGDKKTVWYNEKIPYDSIKPIAPEPSIVRYAQWL